jgi:hypothetical protein
VLGVTGMYVQMKRDCVGNFYMELGETDMKAFEMMRRLFIVENSA